MFQNIGFTELLLIAIIALVLFGPQKLPEIGRVLGRTIRDFKKAANELMSDDPPKQPQPAVTAKASAPASEPVSEAAPAQAQPDAKPAVAFVASAPQPAAPAPEAAPASAEAKPAVTFISNAPALDEPEAAPASAPAAAPVAKPAQHRRLPD